MTVPGEAGTRFVRDDDRRARRRTLLVVLLVCAALAAIWVLPLKPYLEILQAWNDAHPVSGPLSFLLVYVVGTVLMVPGSMLTMLGGFLFGFAVGVPVVSVAAAIGAALAALLTRTVARDWVARRLGNDPRFLAIDDAIADKAFAFVLLSRLSLLLPYNLLNVMYGLARVPLMTIALGTLIGKLPAVMLYVYIGAAARDLDQLLRGDFDSGLAGTGLKVFGLVFVIAITVIIHRAATAAMKRQLGSG